MTYLLLCIEYKAPADGQKTCLKHVDFYSKNKFEKLMHLVGFIIGSSHMPVCLCYKKVVK